MVEKVELKEIINQIRGVSYGKNDVSDTKVDGYVPVLRSNNIQNSRIDLSDLVYVKPEKVKPVQFLKKGDILITASTGSLKVIGKNAQCKDDLNASFGAFCKVVRVKDADHSYLGHLFQSPQYFSYIQNIVNGANINNIKNEHIDNFKIPLPPIKTQQKIAQILDNAAALRNKTAQLIEEYNLLAQSIFLELFGDPVVNPMGWEKFNFKNVLEIRNGKNQKKVLNPNGKYPIYGSGGIMDYADDYISEENSVIIGRKGNINKPILVKEKYWHVDTAFGLNPIREKLDYNYLFFFCKRYDFEQHNKTVTIPSLTKATLLEIKIPVPPIKLQTHFAQKIANIEAQKALARQELKESQDLFNCFLQKAFKGEL